MAARKREARYQVRPDGHGPLRRAGSSGGASPESPRRFHIRRDQRPLPVMVLVQIVGRQHRQIARRREVADHHVAPGFVVHRELAVPQPVRHRRLDLLPAGGPFDGVAGAQVDHAPFPGLVVRQLQLAAHVLGQQAQHGGLRGWRDGGQLVKKDHHQVTLLGKSSGVSRPGHGQEPHAVGRGHRKAAEILRFTNGSHQDQDLALEARALESRLEALGELGLPHTGKAGHVHRDAGLQPDRDQLHEVFEGHAASVTVLLLDTTESLSGQQPSYARSVESSQTRGRPPK